MDTLKIISTLWAVAIPTTILYILVLFVNPKKANKTINAVINTFSFLTFFCWITVISLTVSEGLMSTLILSILMSILLTGIIDAIRSTDKKKMNRVKDYNVKGLNKRKNLAAN